jgi:predicted trehalose synthase
MLRLFDYAAASALDERAAIPPDSCGALQPRSEDWRRAKQVFLAGYRAAIGDCPSFTRNEALLKQLIEICVREKTLYEICYGAANRSGHIPQARVVKIIGHGK